MRKITCLGIIKIPLCFEVYFDKSCHCTKIELIIYKTLHMDLPSTRRTKTNKSTLSSPVAFLGVSQMANLSIAFLNHLQSTVVLFRPKVLTLGNIQISLISTMPERLTPSTSPLDISDTKNTTNLPPYLLV